MAEFSPKECDANVGGLRSNSDEIMGLMERITGKSGDLKALFNDSATEFSDLVADDLKSVAEENHGAWKKSLLACEVARGVMDKWADDVQWYRNQIATLQEKWDDGPEGNAKNGGEPTEKEKDDLAEELNDKADEKWRELKRRADENSDLLEGGPNGDLSPLFEAGVMGWSAYNLANDTQKPQYIPANRERAEKYARDLQPYLNGDKEPDEKYNEMIAFLASINKRAAEKQEEGGRLSHNEINFLETLYNDLDDPKSEHATRLLSIPDKLDGDKSDLSDDDKNDLLSAMGGNLLALSHEDLGGRYDRLPPDVQNVAEGPDVYSQKSAYNGESSDRSNYQSWLGNAEGLGNLLGHAPKVDGAPMEGGKDFSTHLTNTVGHVADQSSQGTYDTPDSNEIQNGGDAGVLGSLLDASTANRDANLMVLNGKDGDDEYSHPEFGNVDPSDTLNGLFTYKWPDDGAEVRGLTDWIAEDSSSKNQDVRQRAGDAAAGLIEHSTTTEMFNNLTDTGVTVGEDDDAAFTQVNPELGDSLTNIFYANIEDFGQNHDDGYKYESREAPNEDKLLLDSRGRVRYLQYLMADENSAENVVGAVELHNANTIDDYVNNETSAEVGANQSGRLKGLLDAAIANEAMDRLKDIEDAHQEEMDLKKKGFEKAADLALGEVPGWSLYGSEVKEYTASILDGRSSDGHYEPLAGNLKETEDTLSRSETNTKFEIRLNALSALENRGDIDTSDVQEELREGERIRSSLNGIPQNQWAEYNGKVGEDLETIWVRIPHRDPEGNFYYENIHDVPPGEERYYDNGREFIDEYAETNWNAYEHEIDRYRSNTKEDYKQFVDGKDLHSLPRDHGS